MNNIPRILIWILLSASVVALINTVRIDENIFANANNSSYIRLYLTYGILVIIFTFLLKSTNETILNSILLISSITVCIYIIEITLYVIYPTPWEDEERRRERAQQSEQYWDPRSIHDVVIDLNNKNIDSVPAIYPTNFIGSNGIQGTSLFPLGSISNKTTVLCNESGKYAIYDSDRFGFNNPNHVWDSVDSTYWAVVGDSFAHGSCVNQGEDIASQLRKITGKSAINLGYGGNGPLIELASIIEYATYIKPKIILWMYYEETDLISDLSNEKKSPILMNYMLNGFTQNLIKRQNEIDNKLLNYIQSLPDNKANKASVISDIIELRHIGHLKHMFWKKPEPSFLFNDILSKARDVAAVWGGKIYFVYLPEYNRYNTNNINHNNYRNRKIILDHVKGLGIKTVDIHNNVFSKQENPTSLFPYETHGHYNSLGYNLVANEIINVLGDNDDRTN